MSTFKTSQTIGDIVSMMPKAGEVFKEFHIDFCCGGHRPLSEAIAEQKLDEKEVLKRLDEAYEETKKFKNQVNFREMKPSELIDYIVNTHHVFLKRELPKLSELTTVILRVHGPNHSELFKVHKLFHNLKTELDQHLIKEEELLFPLIKEYDAKPSMDLLEKIEQVMKETEDEHDAAGDILKELRKITDDYQTPKDGCDTFRMTYQKLEELETDLFQHIHLENNILFKELGLQVENVKM